MQRLTLDPVETLDELDALVEATFSDPEVRRGMGWIPSDDADKALEAIHGLFTRRFEAGWDLRAVRTEDGLAGLVGLGPLDEEDRSPWYAVYLLDRGRGLGRKLTRWALDLAQNRGAREVIAITWQENEPMRNLLDSEGFSLHGEAAYQWAQESELTWLEYRKRLPSRSP